MIHLCRRMSGSTNAALMAALMATLMVLAAPMAVAQNVENTEIHQYGTDVFAAGDDLIFPGTDGNVVGFGRNIDLNDQVGSAVLIADQITVPNGAHGSLIIAGSSITTAGDVGGSSYIAGDTVRIGHNQTAGTLFVAGSSVEVDMSALNDVFIGGDTVSVTGVFGSDIYIAAEAVTIDDNIEIAGSLFHSQPDEVDWPEGIEVERLTQIDLDFLPVSSPFAEKEISVGDRIAGGLWGLFFLTLVGAAAFAIFARQAPVTGRWLSASPVGSILFGVVGLSAVIGATFALLTKILILGFGISWVFSFLLILVPLVLLACVLLALLGYLFGVHAVVALFRPWLKALPVDTSSWLGQVLLLVIGLLVLLAVGLVWSGLADLLGLAATTIGLGVLGQRMAKGQAPTKS